MTEKDGPREEAVTEEDRAWLESDLSRLGDYGAYEWAEGEREALRPVRYVPGVGFVVEGGKRAPANG